MDFIRVKKKITMVLFLSQGLSSAGFIAAFTVNAIVAVSLSGEPSLAGLPGALYVLGMAGGALIWGLTMERTGRRKGLALGQVLGVIGSGIAMAAIFYRSFTFFLTGLILMGRARSAVDLGRFAAAEVHLPADRGQSVRERRCVCFRWLFGHWDDCGRIGFCTADCGYMVAKDESPKTGRKVKALLFKG
ncbi:MAG: MFS transporter [Deltaproteobacteria bacterium]|nr:MFS transporter [Deltaproteobacteria bacterium]